MASDQLDTTTWKPPAWWRIGWWVRWHLRDPGDALDPIWRREMGLPPQ